MLVPIAWALARRRLGGAELTSSFVLMAPAALCLSATLAVLDDHLHHAGSANCTPSPPSPLPPPTPCPPSVPHQLVLPIAAYDVIVYPLVSLAGLCMCIVATCFAPRLCRELCNVGFMPSTALCTFPSVICATAMLQLARHWCSQRCLIAGLVLLGVATLIVVGVTIGHAVLLTRLLLKCMKKQCIDA